ncbi:MAG: LytR/AlgR family response regulator transcription factor, partial [Clostridium sp.]
MIKIGICDDDKKIRNEIKKAIESYKNLEYTLNTYECGEMLLEDMKEFDVIFLDIDMGGINGIETAKKIRKYDKSVK